MKFISYLIPTTAIAAALLQVGCGTLKTKDKDQVSVDQVKKVALIAYSAQMPAARQLGFDLGSGKLGGEKGGSVIHSSIPEVDQVLSEITQTVRQKLKWNVMDVDQMKKHPSYVAAYKATMEGFQNKMPTPPGYQGYLVSGVMDFDSPRILDEDGRSRLIEELGVDALIVAKLDVQIEASTFMGIGNRYPKSVVAFFVYKKGQANPIWFESFAGEPAKESIGKTGFIDEKKMAKLAVSSAKSALAQINQ